MQILAVTWYLLKLQGIVTLRRGASWRHSDPSESLPLGPATLAQHRMTATKIPAPEEPILLTCLEITIHMRVKSVHGE